MEKTSGPYYRKNDLWTLFLMSAFPIHLWTIIIVLSDVGWISERTNLWDAVGVGAYALVIAFIESVFVFAVAAGLGFLISRRWRPSARVVLMSMLVFLVSAWAIVEQLWLVPPVGVPEGLFRMMVRSGHPLWYLYGLGLFFAGITALPLTFVILRFEGVRNALKGMIERLSLLTSLYLLLDVASVVIIVTRNLDI